MAENSAKTAKKRSPGRAFRAGQSGNPGGRPKQIGHVKELARLHTVEAIEALVAAIRSRGVKALPSRVRAAEALLDRAWGRPDVTANVKIQRNVRDLSDEQLLAIISGERAALETAGEEQPHNLH